MDCFFFLAEEETSRRLDISTAIGTKLDLFESDRYLNYWWSATNLIKLPTSEGATIGRILSKRYDPLERENRHAVVFLIVSHSDRTSPWYERKPILSRHRLKETLKI